MRVCIVYDTKRKNRATSHIVRWIREAFSDNGIQADVKQVSEVKDFNYDLFIIGSPIYWERPMKSVVSFLSENRDILQGKKLAIFIVCMANMFGHFTESYIKSRYLKPLKELVGALTVESGVFRGWIKKANFNERQEVIKWVKDIVVSYAA